MKESLKIIKLASEYFRTCLAIDIFDADNVTFKSEISL
jgi:hypothetical protein